MHYVYLLGAIGAIVTFFRFITGIEPDGLMIGTSLLLSAAFFIDNFLDELAQRS